MKKNVCLLISNLAGGGAQRVVSILSKSLSSYYHLYLILHDGRKINYQYSGEVVDLKTLVTKSKPGKAFNFVFRALKLYLIKKRLKPAIVISFMEGSNFINLLSGRAGKNAISVRNYKKKRKRSLLARVNDLLIEKLYRRSDIIIAVSEGVKSGLVNNFSLPEDKIKVIYNPLDINYIKQKAVERVDKEWEEVFRKQVLVTAGSMTEQKGHWHLIRAFKKIKETNPEMKLVILGEGKLRPDLERIVIDLGLQGDVLFPGFQENPFKYISKSSIFILPSLYEGFPNALLEAMSCGLPVIACDCLAGPREILAPDSDINYRTEVLEFASFGLLTPVVNGTFYHPEAVLSKEEAVLVSAVHKLEQDKKLKNEYSRKSIDRAQDFALDNIVKHWISLIEN